MRSARDETNEFEDVGHHNHPLRTCAHLPHVVHATDKRRLERSLEIGRREALSAGVLPNAGPGAIATGE